MATQLLSVGIDVSARHLDLACHGQRQVRCFANVEAGRAQLVAELLPLQPRVVVLEATGGYETALLVDLVTAGLPAARVVASRARHFAASRGQLATMDAVGALRQGDDLGFRTATFLSPDVLRRLVLPIYTQLAAAAHAHGKPFILHSCGNLGSVYDDLIDTCRIDAKHSFEDSILPVEDFQARYGQRVTPLGGLDVDAICRLDEPALRAYVEHKIERCTSQGYWALGTGNSLTDYMPVDRYLLVLETGSGYFS